MKRIIIAMNVPDDTDLHEFVTDLEYAHDDSDPTAWTFDQFFDDLDDNVISRTHDNTRSSA